MISWKTVVKKDILFFKWINWSETAQKVLTIWLYILLTNSLFLLKDHIDLIHMRNFTWIQRTYYLCVSGQDSNTKAPVLELPFPQKNVSDVVVIETQHLRIIENKAVLPLAVFLVLAILLLFVVALRLRIVKSKLKRRPFATDDADYLINGMYL